MVQISWKEYLTKKWRVSGPMRLVKEKVFFDKLKALDYAIKASKSVSHHEITICLEIECGLVATLVDGKVILK